MEMTDISVYYSLGNSFLEHTLTHTDTDTLALTPTHTFTHREQLA